MHQEEGEATDKLRHLDQNRHIFSRLYHCNHASDRYVFTRLVNASFEVEEPVELYCNSKRNHPVVPNDEFLPAN